MTVENREEEENEWNSVEVRKSLLNNAGQGLFALKSFEVGETVCTYRGDILTLAALLKKENRDYVMGGFGLNCHIDAEKHLNVPGRYINDHPDDIGSINCKFVKLKSEKKAEVVAIRRIEAGEELYCSYGECYWRNSVEMEECNRGTDDWAVDSLSEIKRLDSDPTTPIISETPPVINERPKPTSELKEPDKRPHLNVVFIGHVDAGKSTTCGNILYLSGQVDDRTMEKYEKEAKEKNRESWFLAFIMDTNEEERNKGKTVEVGKALFETDNRRFTILDAPGHKSFVPNMIEGAAQADLGVLLISARKGEFETGFDRGGQTREHALLARTIGINKLIVAVNKMDDSTCDWSEKRYRDIEVKLTPYLKSCGYNPAVDVRFVPISGLNGQNVMKHVSDPEATVYTPKANWYPRTCPSLWELFDTSEPPERDPNGPLRIPILDGYRENGTIAVGKVESGTVCPGTSYFLMPNKNKVKVISVYFEDTEFAFAAPGENVRVKLTGVEEDQVSKGFVLCSMDSPCSVVTEFIGRIAIVELLEHRPILTAGYCCVLHAHTACDEVEVVALLESVDKKTKKKKLNPQFAKSDSILLCKLKMTSPICVEEFDKFPQLGRFTLRDEGKTIAIGKVQSITIAE